MKRIPLRHGVPPHASPPTVQALTPDPPPAPETQALPSSAPPSQPPGPTRGRERLRRQWKTGTNQGQQHLGDTGLAALTTEHRSAPPPAADNALSCSSSSDSSLEVISADASPTSSANTLSTPSEIESDQASLSWQQQLVCLASGTDTAQLLKHGDTQAVLDQLRYGTPGDSSSTGLLDQLTDNLRGLRHELMHTLTEEADLSPQLRGALLGGLDSIQNSLEGMRSDPKTASRALTIAIVNLASSALPLAVPLAVSPRQTLFAAEMSAVVAKALVEASAMVALPWVDMPLVSERWQARYLVNNLQAVYFLATVFTQKPAKNIAYNLVGGVAAVVTLFGAFMSREFREGAATLRGTQPYASLQKSGSRLSDETKTSLHSVLTHIRAEQKDLEAAKTAFEETQNVNALLSKRVSLAIDTYRTMASKLSSTINEERPPRHEDPDRSTKLALALVTGIITGAGVALMWPETIGVADLGSDALFATALQLSIAFDSTKSSADALDDFKTFSGFSIVLAAVLGANKLADDYLAKGPHGPLVGALVMMALNLTIPGAVGKLAARALSAAASSTGDFTRMCWEIGHNLYALLAHPASPSVDEQELAQQV
jgi:hypothetical protein